MPSLLTHDIFGADTLGTACSLLGFASFDEHDAFMLGNQGPDPLFYLHLDPLGDKKDADIGDIMHHRCPSQLFVALHDALSMLPREERHVGEAYAAGFLCHYLLDSTLHPFVFSWEYSLCDAGVEGLDRRCSSLVHREIERDLDEMALYARTGNTVRNFVPWKCVLEGSDATLATIDRIYFYLGLWTYNRTLPLDIYTRAIKAYRRALRLFWSPYGGKIRLFGAVEHLVRQDGFSLYDSMSHRVRREKVSDFDNRQHQVWRNPFTGVLNQESFWDLYDKACCHVAQAEKAFFSSNFNLAAAERMTGELNFSGAPAVEQRDAVQIDGS
jgi:hypothetical protein